MKIEKQYIILGQRLRELREEKGIPQLKVAQDLSFPKSSYQGYESASARLSLEALDKLAFYFNVSIDYLLGKTDIRTPYPHSDEDFYMLYGKVPKRAPVDWKSVDKNINLEKIKKEYSDFKLFISLLEYFGYSTETVSDPEGDEGYLFLSKNGKRFELKLPEDQNKILKDIELYTELLLIRDKLVE
ncbi:helix-turn-helix transcriptional regulator [Fusobacterium sp.]|uniref:helix-turn-helix domain-containing protein n=1 Tax=Fusobacterium sp. TaxID=68766 RepID=UPI0028FED7FB|nr:helix-turn-helix transcriptional regulator [Fusobacterium sp.]MDU1909717.1 helix-turn-helix transcriptional regulator [Fusobacterium sp.]